jgi:LacI family transcriptional regulator
MRENKKASKERNPSTVTVRGLAQHLGLSAATVSTALNGARPAGFVTEATRQQVWQAAREMGYPLEKLRARRPALERVAVFVHRFSVFQATALEICERLSGSQSQVMLHIGDDDHADAQKALFLFQRGEIDGAIFLGSRDKEAAGAVGDVPCVFIGDIAGEGPTAEHWRVSVDNPAGARLAAEHLLALGHQRVGAVMPDHAPPAAVRRLLHFAAAWQDAGLAFTEDHTVYVPYDLRGAGRQNVLAFLQRHQQAGAPVTALFCYNDRIAAHILTTLHQNCIPVPGQVSVVGFDDVDYASLLLPSLTTVHNPFEEQGRLAVDLLHEQLRDPAAPPRTVVLECSLIARGSTSTVSPSFSLT